MTRQSTQRGGIGEKLSGRLVDELQNLAGAAGERLVSAASDRLGSATERLTAYAEQGGGPGLIAAATGARRLADGKSPVRAAVGAGLAGGKAKLKQALGKGGPKNKIKVTNIVETIDVGAPVRVVYNQWTQFGDFPRFMKKVEHAERESDRKITWKAQIFWSHRSWESTVTEQVPDERIVWRSTGEKGSVDGAVSFHELTPDLTRIVLVLEYHPQGLFEKTGNIWRAQGRRVRLELKHFVRHVMTHTVLHPDQVEGWRGEIRAGRVVRDHDSAVAAEKREQTGSAADERGQRNGSAGEEPASGGPARKRRDVPDGDPDRRGAPAARRPHRDDQEPPHRDGERPRRSATRRMRSSERSGQ
ncbi:SRPBCC family protein [Micromonospora sp. NPDC049679]|uniref:SRPBCC family protein n=1 Tax=Micromonospora sp. NPDC049679 TaxID=3155920 RepID=UPI0033DBA021